MKQLALVLTLTIIAAGPVIAKSGAEIIDASGVKGGLVVHLGCGDGRLTAALRVNDRYLIHGLDTEAENIRKAREHISQLGLYGVVTVDRWNGTDLPYIDNLVNLIVVEDGVEVARSEIMRVLAPGGVAAVKKDGRWTTAAKRQPEATDEWTHYLHGPDNNAVSSDRAVSYPYHMQWVGLPKWTRNHNFLNSYSAVVSTAGRIFSIVDEAPSHSVYYPPRWNLVARDAYNGIVVWKKPIGPWEGHLRRFRSGPTELPRRLVACGRRVYVTLGYGKPVTALDAASGEIVRVYGKTEGTHEILYSDGTLYLVSGVIDSAAYQEAQQTGSHSPQIQNKRILAVDAETAEVRWIKRDSDTSEMLPTTLCADETRLFFNSPDHLVCLDRKSGSLVWKKPRPVERNRLAWSAPTVVVYGDVVLSAEGKHIAPKAKAGAARRRGKTEIENVAPRESGSSLLSWTVTASPNSDKGGQVIAFRASDGKELWRCDAAFGYSSPPNLFVADGLVWVSNEPGINESDITEGRDPLTGEVKRSYNTAEAFDAAHHHRCYRDKATDRFILFGRTGVEFVDLTSGDIQRHYWIRGTCQYGLLPANGLMYLPGHSCGCYVQSKLNGFWALAPKRESGIVTIDENNRLQRGPAYGQIANRKPKIENATAWPMLRHDPGRSGSTKTAIPANPKLQWQTKLEGRPTSPVISAGRVVVALKDSHSVVAMNAQDGSIIWKYTTGGRIDSPPALYEGMAIVGSHDGYLYCLRLLDGQLAWRFRAAPADRRSVAFGQIESIWPVVGSVLVYDGALYCTAGRTSYLDGGITLFKLDPATGIELARNQFYSRDPETGKQPDSLLEDVELPGTLPDILTVEKGDIFLRDKKLDADCAEDRGTYLPHLYSSAGLLDDNWWHRTYWIWGERAWGRASGWAVAGRHRPSGRILVHDGPVVYGYDFSDGQGVHTGGPGKNRHRLFCADKKIVKVNRKLKNNNAAVTKYMTPDKVVTHWSRSIELCGRAMIKAGDALFVAGPEPAEEIYFDDQNAPSVLAVYDAGSGRTLSKQKIDCQPVFDGMAAAGGRIYISLVWGEVVCLGD
ncbi:MAG: outer membrane protein assembly factor BamB family protein [Planctomycetota bacterium]|jgi:outer membrane protein assembly factor BamB